MFKTSLKVLAAAFLLSGSMYFTSCKGKAKEADNTNTTTTTAPAQTTAPVEIAQDDALTTGVKDATKDYPGVKAEVNDGEVTLTGELQRSKLQNLMQSLQSLHPKKINNQLTLK